MAYVGNDFCPVHGIDVHRSGYDIGDGWKRCPISVAEPIQGICLFSRQ
jgi:hypothetical protein